MPGPSMTAPSVIAPVPPARALRWLGDGLRLWLRAPVSLVLLCLTPMIVELLVQQLPIVGVIVSKLVGAVLSIGLWVGIDRVARDGRPRAQCLVEGLRAERRAATITMVMVTLVVFAMQVAVAAALVGGDAYGLVTGRVTPEMRSTGFALAVIISGQVPMMLIGLAPAFALFEAMRPAAAIRRSVRVVRGAVSAFGALLLIFAGLLAISLVGNVVLFALTLPWMLATTYAAFRDVHTL